MADKIVQVTAQTIVGNVPVYTPKSVDLTTPKVVAGDTTPAKLTTAVESPKILGTLTGMGEESIPNPSLFKRLDDYYHITDKIAVTFKLTKADLFNVSDYFSRVVQYKRIFQEYQSTNDNYKVFIVRKGLLDTTHNSEVVKQYLGKVLQDSITRQERISLVYGKNVFENVATTEELLKVAYKKAANELVSSQDLLTRVVNFNRTFADYIDATDDFYGEANIDDDQIAKVGKSAIDWLTSSDIESAKISIVKSDLATSSEQKVVGLYKPFNDTSISSEQARLMPSKVLSDSSSNYDSQRYSVGKVLLDIGHYSDINSKNTGKYLIDYAVSTEQKSVLGTKILSDQYITSDSLSRVWQAYKSFTDNSVTSQLITFNIKPTILDISNTYDTPSYNTGKILLDNSNLSDLFSRTVDYKRLFTDQIDATDDFYGNANIDDDQIATVNKMLIDYGTTGEIFSAYSSKILADSFTKTDTIYNNPNKVLLDNIGKYDISSYYINKVLLDIGSTQEVVTIYSTKVISDNYSAIDIFNRIVSYNRSFTDGIIKSDLTYFNTSKVLSDSTHNSDTVYTATTFNRRFTDSISRSELQTFNVSKNLIDIYHVSERLSVNNSKILSDIFTRTDTVYNTPKKVVVEVASMADIVTLYKYSNRYIDDIATTNDSGTINNQSYFAGTYVEPGYVGTNTYFS